jgi:hypothetical protein
MCQHHRELKKKWRTCCRRQAVLLTDILKLPSLSMLGLAKARDRNQHHCSSLPAIKGSLNKALYSISIVDLGGMLFALVRAFQYASFLQHN